MTRYLKHTEVSEHRPNGSVFVLNEIRNGDKFSGITVPKSLVGDQVQEYLAQEVKKGWDINGPHRGVYRYEVAQVFIENGEEIKCKL